MNAGIQLFNEISIVHKLSHQHLFTKFWIISTDHHQKALINWQEIELFPVPVLIANFLKEYKPKLKEIF